MIKGISLAALLLAASAWLGMARPSEGPGLEELRFLVGAWETRGGSARIEEHWIPPAGGTLFGVSRTVKGDRTVAFEFLRIEARPGGVYYVAQPGGGPATEFKLTRLEAGEAVFENPEHDHPKIIRYRSNPDGSLAAQIEGDEKGKHLVQDFAFHRQKN
jgi:hypothetical protein